MRTGKFILNNGGGILIGALLSAFITIPALAADNPPKLLPATHQDAPIINPVFNDIYRSLNDIKATLAGKETITETEVERIVRYETLYVGPFVNNEDNLHLGDGTSDGITLSGNGSFYNDDYVADTSGWLIDKTGTVYFNEGFFRGTIHAQYGDFAGFDIWLTSFVSANNKIVLDSTAETIKAGGITIDGINNRINFVGSTINTLVYTSTQTRPNHYSAAGFTGSNLNNYGSRINTSILGQNVYGYSSANFPDDAVISTFTAYMYNDDISAVTKAELFRTCDIRGDNRLTYNGNDLTYSGGYLGASTPVLMACAEIAGGSGYAKAVDTTISEATIDNADYSYYIRFTLKNKDSATDAQFISSKFDWDITKPLP